MQRCGICAKDLDGVRYFDVSKDSHCLKDKKITFPSGVRRIHVCIECLMEMLKRKE